MTRHLALLLLLLALASANPGAQHHQPGSAAMGFDLTAVTHHFVLKRNGGSIDVEVRRSSDVTTRDSVRTHLRHIAVQFAAGDFEAPFVTHGEMPPGVAALQRLKSSVRYTYAPTRNGGRVDIVTGNTEALAAVHEFLRYQIAEHRTGDPPTVKAR